MKNLKKQLTALEAIIRESGYRLRYEKGNFQAGYCTVEQEKIVLVNKFLDTGARYNCLLNLIESLSIDRSLLSSKNKTALDEIRSNLQAAKSNLFNLQNS
jgi:hypothetical protein